MLWNWQDNVREGLYVLGTKKSGSQKYLNGLEKANPAAYAEDRPPLLLSEKHTFSALEALQIETYNGAGKYIDLLTRPARPGRGQEVVLASPRCTERKSPLHQSHR